MRLMVFFDLPMLTAQQRRAYTIFRKELLNEGFLMIQESVYVRITTSKQSAELLEKRIKNSVPEEGLIQTLMITEKQYTGMHFLVGNEKKEIRNSAERVIVI